MCVKGVKTLTLTDDIHEEDCNSLVHACELAHEFRAGLGVLDGAEVLDDVPREDIRQHA